MKRLTQVPLLLACAACLAAPLTSHSQAYPSKPIRMVVGAAPGGGVDLLARLISPKLIGALGQPVLVENRAGANGTIGGEFVARSAPDGYTILFTSPGSMMGISSTSIPYDALRDFTPITLAVEPVSCLSFSSSVPANSVKELVELAKRNPGKLSYASTGIGSPFHLMGEVFKQLTGTDIIHIPYKGVGPSMADLTGGQISMAFSSVANALPFMRAGKLKVIAVTGAMRYPALPDVPTVAESVPGFQRPPVWYALFGPAGLPQPILARLNGEIVKALNAPDIRSKLDSEGLLVVASTPDQFAAELKSGIEVFGRAVKAAGIKME